MQPSKNPGKNILREKLERAIQSYLEGGGTITVVPPGTTAEALRLSRNTTAELTNDDDQNLELLEVDNF